MVLVRVGVEYGLTTLFIGVLNAIEKIRGVGDRNRILQIRLINISVPGCVAMSSLHCRDTKTPGKNIV